MKKIKLTNGGFAIVDDEDFEELSKFNWYKNKPTLSRVFYVRRGVWIDGKTKIEFMHRRILGLGFYTQDKRQVDHINHNGQDNRKKNLRICTDGQNKYNTRVQKNKKNSKYKGIEFCDWLRNKVWRARINKDRKRIHIGVYFTEREAALAYDQEAIKLFGEFAHLNFPLSPSNE